MKLNELTRPEGRKARKRRRLGRGDGSGRGGTAGKGHKGQKARAGGYHKIGFEGGQVPLARRLPKRGFTNIFRKEIAIVNVDQLNIFPAKSEVTKENLAESRLIKRRSKNVKLLGRGELKHPLKITVQFFSPEAKKKVEAAGGTLEVKRG